MACADRLKAYREIGARFAKWRAVISCKRYAAERDLRAA